MKAGNGVGRSHLFLWEKQEVNKDLSPKDLNLDERKMLEYFYKTEWAFQL